MRQLASQKPGDPDQVYASGLYLSGNDQDRAALAHLNTLPRDKWNGNIQALADRLQSNQVLETANRLRDSGKEQEAETLLRQQPPSTRIDLTLADWAEQRGDHEAAKTAYNTILQREPQNEDAILGLTEVSLARATRTRRARRWRNCPRHRTANRSPSICSAGLPWRRPDWVILPRQKRPSTPFFRRPNRSRLRWKVRW